MNKLFLICILISLNCYSQEKLIDVSYTFDEAKLSQTKNAFHFSRSFVDYYYLLLKENENQNSIFSNARKFNGWCVGDAHPENFGILIKNNNERLYTHNDIDDSGPCPVIYDFFRMLLTSKLFQENLVISELMNSYLMGLNHEFVATPKVVSELLSKSSLNGMTPSKTRVSENKIVRDESTSELVESEKQEIQTLFLYFEKIINSNFTIIDTVKYTKVSGGSGGLTRYEILIQNDGENILLELKPEIIPSIYPIADSIPVTEIRINKSLEVDQGVNYSIFYRYVKLEGRDYILRPKFSGNVSSNIDKNTDSVNSELINYQFYTLGQIHSKTILDLNNYIFSLKLIGVDRIESRLNDYSNFFKEKYSNILNK